MTTNRLELMVVDAWERPARFGGVGFGDADADDEMDDFTPGGRELLIAIDGRLELEASWDGMGMEPDELLNPAMPLLPPQDGAPADVIVQRCGCGEVGCDSLTVTITRDGHQVCWSNFRGRTKLQEIGPFVFDAVAYETEVVRAHRERSWESTAERVARLVTDELGQHRDARPLAFEWACGRSDGSVEVSYSDYRSNPAAGEQTPLGRAGFFSVAPDELHDQFSGRFELASSKTDDENVSDLVGLIRSTHPRSWPGSQRVGGTFDQQ